MDVIVVWWYFFEFIEKFYLGEVLINMLKRVIYSMTKLLYLNSHLKGKKSRVSTVPKQGHFFFKNKNNFKRIRRDTQN